MSVIKLLMTRMRERDDFGTAAASHAVCGIADVPCGMTAECLTSTLSRSNDSARGVRPWPLAPGPWRHGSEEDLEGPTGRSSVRLSTCTTTTSGQPLG